MYTKTICYDELLPYWIVHTNVVMCCRTLCNTFGADDRS